MEKLDARVSSRIREFSARGSDNYNAPSSDNSAEQRAVEVHVYLVPVPPPPPPNVDPIPPLPGGTRYTSWAVAAPFSVSSSVFPGAVAAANVVAFRRHERHDETHTYLVPGGGLGWSFGGPKLGKLVEMIKSLLGKVNYSGMSFTDTTAVTPFNFRDLEGSTCELRSAEGALALATSSPACPRGARYGSANRAANRFSLTEISSKTSIALAKISSSGSERPPSVDR
jgi:hypothetical protein